MIFLECSPLEVILNEKFYPQFTPDIRGTFSSYIVKNHT